MNRFSIKDIENLTGIKAHTLRVWEQRHGIIIPKRTDTNIRYYDAEDLKKALKVSLLNRHGYKISRIQKMGDSEIDSVIHQKTDEGFRFEALLNELLSAAVDMDIDTFEKQLDGYIQEYGLENMIEELVFSFLEKIGLMWMTNRILPAQEHLTSNVISRKILLAIEKSPRKYTSNAPKVLMFLPEGEIHELGLLYAQYLLIKHGKIPIYLGANTPIDQVGFVNSVLKPNYLYTHITSVSNDFNINKYLDSLTDICPAKNIFVSGSMLQKLKYTSGNKDVIFLNSLQDVKDIFSVLSITPSSVKH